MYRKNRNDIYKCHTRHSGLDPESPTEYLIKFNNNIMAKVINGLYYSESHEWVKVEGNIAIVGISDFAQHEMGDLSYVDMPEVDDELEKGEEFGAVESVKAASDLYSPVSGTVVEINEELEDAPELLNQDAFANWIMKVEMSDPSELEDLMDAAAYEAMCANE